MTDCHFPIINYLKTDSPRQWGLDHGEGFRKPIQELALIRKNLLLARRPDLKDALNSLAIQQAQYSKQYSPTLFEEMQGIAQGANTSLEDIVILNNYTDFRDIELPAEGCSTVSFAGEELVSGPNLGYAPKR